MAIKKVENGWLVDVQPAGRGGKRYRKTFQMQREAKAWENWLKTQINKNSEWAPERRDTRKLLELAQSWWDNHGKNLRAGEDTYNRIQAAIKSMGNPIASEFTTSNFSKYRSDRIEAGIKLNTINREHAYLRSMFNELIRLKLWKKENPLKELRQFKVQENELSYLSRQQIIDLLDSLKQAKNEHVQLIAEICLSTGARWSEGEQLRLTQIRNQQITFARTKTNRARTVPITEELQSKILEHAKKHPVQISGAIFETSYSAFREALKRANINLPAGQLTHVLRHSFASHFMINGGNILSLQRILGHKDLKTTMRYAHLAPEHLEEAKTLNPLATAKSVNESSTAKKNKAN